MLRNIPAIVVEQIIRKIPGYATQIHDMVAGALQSYETLGFVTTFGNWYSYINAVGVAFRPTDGTPLVALTCGGIVDLVPRQVCLEKVGPDLVSTVERLRAALSGMSESPVQAVLPKDWKTTAE